MAILQLAREDGSLRLTLMVLSELAMLFTNADGLLSTCITNVVHKITGMTNTSSYPEWLNISRGLSVLFFPVTHTAPGSTPNPINAPLMHCLPSHAKIYSTLP